MKTICSCACTWKFHADSGARTDRPDNTSLCGGTGTQPTEKASPLSSIVSQHGMERKALSVCAMNLHKICCHVQSQVGPA